MKRRAAGALFGWLLGGVVLGGMPVGAAAQSVYLHERDAVAWAQEQQVRGRVEGTDAAGTLYVDAAAVPFTAVADTFAIPVTLGRGSHVLVACAPAGGGEVCSDTLRLTLGYVPRPEVFTYATAEGQTVQLHARVLSQPGEAPLAFAWAADPGNPLSLSPAAVADTLAQVSFPAEAPSGEYYFDLQVTSTAGDTASARTFVTVDASGRITPFDIETDHAAWVDRAVIYEIAPRFFADGFNGKFRHITEKLPELIALGVNTIWLQPIYATHDGQQAYDVTGYFEVWDALGPEEDLRALVDAAHAAGMRVMLDFVPNHSSIYHPYAQDAIAHGDRSHYYDFYMRTRDQAPYAVNYNVRREGEMTFIYYFWPELVTFDFDNPEVQRFIIEASRYWVERFDIDGYRLDAVWGPHARNPAFTAAWRLALKRIKPELFLLAEAKAPYSDAFKPMQYPSIFEPFDAAYDWTAEAGYISRWAFQVGNDRGRTIFNAVNERLRAERVRGALTNDGEGFHPDALILRYIENNDTPRFVENHTVAQTKMAAALMFSLPGVPMLYYGQEAGVSNPYPSYSLSRTIASYDRHGFFPFYRHLVYLRKHFPALYSDHLEEVEVLPSGAAASVYAYRRWEGEDNIFGVVNMGAAEAVVRLPLPVDALPVAAEETYYLTELVSGDAFAVPGAALDTVAVTVPGATTALYALAGDVITVPTPVEPPGVPLPAGASLAPNYPNPFGASTVIPFTLPQGGFVRLRVFDVLGREVARPVEGVLQPGRHTATFDARHLPSGLYLCRLEHPAGRDAMTMLLVR